MTARLEGRVVAVTRHAGEDDRLSAALRREGADVRPWPTLAFLEPEDEAPLLRSLNRLSDYDWLAFTSPRAVDAVTRRSGWTEGSGRVAAVGAATAEALDAAGWPVHLVGDDGAAALARALAAAERLEGRTVLFFAGSMARDALEDALAAEGARIDRVEAYRTEVRPPPAGSVRSDLDGGVDAVLFASPSAVRGLSAAIDGALALALAGTVVVAIGPTTASALHEAGLTGCVVAAEPSFDALVDACVQALDPIPDPR